MTKKPDPQYIAVPEMLEAVALINSENWTPHDIATARRLMAKCIRSLERSAHTVARMALLGDFSGSPDDLKATVEEIRTAAKERDSRGWYPVLLPNGTTLKVARHRIEPIYATPSSMGIPWEGDGPEPTVKAGSQVILTPIDGPELHIVGHTLVPANLADKHRFAVVPAAEEEEEPPPVVDPTVH